MLVKKTIGLLIFTVLILAVFTGSLEARVLRASVRVDGMSCPFCTYGVEKRLKKVEGVGFVSIDLKSGAATATAVENGSIDIKAIPAAVEKAGFTPGRVKAVIHGSVRKESDGRFVLVSERSDHDFVLVDLSKPEEERLEKFSSDGTLVEVEGTIIALEENLPEIKLIRIQGISR